MTEKIQAGALQDIRFFNGGLVKPPGIIKLLSRYKKLLDNFIVEHNNTEN